MSHEQIIHYENKLKFEIDSWDLFELLKKKDPLVVIDTRAAAAFQARHIPGARNLPHATMDDLTTAHLDKAQLYVTYCDGIGCNASTKGALRMARLGFRVKELMGGLDWWIRDGYATHGSQGTPGKTTE